MIPPLIEEHAKKLKRMHPQLELTDLSSQGVQAISVEIKNVPLPTGWNRPVTTVKFLVPLAYPAAPPDCFWTEPGLALADGRPPQGSGVQAMPGTTEQVVWFSWHVQQWDPNIHTVSSFLELIKDRFRRIQ